MNKIETDFDKLKHYEDIETYYPPLDDIKDFLYELFGDRVESQKYIVRTNQKLEQLQSNWNSLRELLENEKKAIEEDELFCYLSNKDYIEFILDKMNELEKSDNK